MVQVHYGLGRHKFYLSTWDFIEFQKYSYGEWLQTFQTLMFTKVSICLFLLRIPVETHLIRPLQGMIAGLIVSNMALTIVWIVQCRPLAAAWNSNIQGHCFTQGQLQRIIISQALISIISDIILAIFPIFILWKVQISVRVKAGMCTLMSLGLITAACCIVRTVLNGQNVNEDPTWESVDNWHLRSWEVCIGISAASIPALRPGYKHLVSTISTYRSRSSSRKASSALVDDHPTNGAQNNRTNYRKEDLIDDRRGKSRNILPLEDLSIIKTKRIDVDRDRSFGGDSGGGRSYGDGEGGRRVEDII